MCFPFLDHATIDNKYIMAKYSYTDVIVDVKGQIGTIKVSIISELMLAQADASQLNRPKALNSFGGSMEIDIVAALRELDNHPDTVFTVLTGEGRFFSAGADVRAPSSKGVQSRLMIQ